MRNIAIFGAGGMAREVAFVIEAINKSFIAPEWNILGFIDIDPTKVGTQVGRYKVLCTEDDIFKQDWAKAFVGAIGIGAPKTIQKVATSFYPRIEFPNLVWPGTIWDNERVLRGCGNIITAGNIFTTDIEIGSFNTLNRSSTCGHDAKIGDYNIINPSVVISGCVTIGNTNLIGTKAAILEGRKVGNNAIVGGGAIVTKDVPDGITVVGIPARNINDK